MSEEISIDDILINGADALMAEPDNSNAIKALASVEQTDDDLDFITEDLDSLIGRQRMWDEKCRDIFVDLRFANYKCIDEDSIIEVPSYPKPLYFKCDPDSQKDPKIVLAMQQFCKLVGIPFAFFFTNRPTLKMNIVKTWQAGLNASEDKAQCVFKIRESDGCNIIRAIVPITRSVVPLPEILQIIKDNLKMPFHMEFAFGDDKDDLILHARFIFDKEYVILNEPVNIGFSLIASELDAGPLTVDVLLHNKNRKTSYIATYGMQPFFKSRGEGIKTQQIKDLIPKLMERLEKEADEIIRRVNERIGEMSDIFVESECATICRYKGFNGQIKKAIYQQVTECHDDIRNPWDFATHVGLVAKDLDSIRRLDVERGIGRYLGLTFGKDEEGKKNERKSDSN